MLEPRFDPAHKVRFDLGRGTVELEGHIPQLLVPVDGLLELLDAAGPEALRNFGRKLGTEVGRRFAERLGSDLSAASVETLVEHLGGELAVLGLGSISLERWGRALLLTVASAPAGSTGGELLAAVLEGALQRGTSRDARVVVVEREAESLRLLVVGANAAARVKSWVQAGTGLAEVLGRLHGRGGQ